MRGWPLLVVAVLVVCCGEPVATAEPIFLTVAGSMAMAPLVTELAQDFHERNPTTTLEVSGLGSQFGLDSLRRGTVDLAFVSWLPATLEPTWRTTAIARDGIAIVVHPSNPVQALGLLQLRDLFSGRVHEWAVVGGQRAQGQVLPVSREEGAGAHAAFESLVMDGQRVTPRAVVLLSPGAVTEYVAEHREAIGYVSMSEVSSTVRVVPVEGNLPTPESTGRGSYALTHELWLVAADPPARPAESFIDFVLSPAGQQVVARHYGRIR
jgi:phosphate transport system substrate-binding protein